MPRTDDEPIEPAPRDDELDESQDEQEDVGGNVGPASPLDSGLFWLS